MPDSVAVVTGAARGFGRAIAERLAAAGHTVLVTDIDLEGARDTAAALGGASWAMALDVRDPDAHRAVAAAAAERGRLAVWVNNAGVARAGKTWEHPDDDVRLTFDVNAVGVMWGSRAAVEVMARHPEGGSVLNIASLAGLGPVPGVGVYAASKAAVVSFTTSLQADLKVAHLPIRAHVLCPDAADTKMVRDASRSPDSAILHSAPRLLEPGEVADAAMKLLGSRRIVRSLPQWRALTIRLAAPVPSAGLPALRALRWAGERRRRRFVPGDGPG